MSFNDASISRQKGLCYFITGGLEQGLSKIQNEIKSSPTPAHGVRQSRYQLCNDNGPYLPIHSPGTTGEEGQNWVKADINDIAAVRKGENVPGAKSAHKLPEEEELDESVDEAKNAQGDADTVGVEPQPADRDRSGVHQG
ncbi:hypothetical protein DXG01_014608 [Tephrocybe rancida]|nr:hypothetical protein DXG01_014608 [Tephrocybe rancida]